MRTNVVIDDGLMTQAMEYSGLTTKRAVIEEALKTFVRLKMQEQVRGLRGQLYWDGDLDQMRESRTPYVDR